MFIFQGVGQVAKKKWPSLVLITNCRENPLNESWDSIAVPGFLARPEVHQVVGFFCWEQKKRVVENEVVGMAGLWLVLCKVIIIYHTFFCYWLVGWLLFCWLLFCWLVGGLVGCFLLLLWLCCFFP